MIKILIFSLSIREKTSQKISKDIVNLNNSINFLDIYETLHQTTSEYTFLSSAHSALRRSNHGQNPGDWP